MGNDGFPPRMPPAEAAEFVRRRRGRNIALLVVLLALVVLFFVLTLVKLSGQHFPQVGFLMSFGGSHEL